MLPQEFVSRMKETLQDEFEAFYASYDRERFQALRVNTLKTDISSFIKEAPFVLEPVAWEERGFYYSKEDKPGKHPFHEAGVYYIQEPSAMAPVTYLNVEPGDRVLDLCAAPGGKTTQIASYMEGQGLLVTNEIHPTRAKILSENVERMGICNAIVTNETPEKLVVKFHEFFDKILVDAPCSGEGMFVKNENAGEEWSLEHVLMCAERQDGILDCAADMLAPGGRIVYSTCTFSTEENEGCMERFLQRHDDFRIVPVEPVDGMVQGKDGTIRLWPHKLKGEGHYLAVLEKSSEGEETEANGKRTIIPEKNQEKGLNPKNYPEYLSFVKEYLDIEPNGKLITFGEQLYLVPMECPSLNKLKVLRPGLHLGTLKKNRFEPSHALALSLKVSEVKSNYEASGEQIEKYLNGQSIEGAGVKGWTLITYHGYSIGWGKASGGVIKNHYPKGLRIEYRK